MEEERQSMSTRDRPKLASSFRVLKKGKSSLSKGSCDKPTVLSKKPSEIVEDEDENTSYQSSVSLYVRGKVRNARKRYSSSSSDSHDDSDNHKVTICSSYLQFLIEERGILSFRFFSLLGGIFIVVASSLDYFGSFQELGYGKKIQVLFALWMLAIFVIQLEGRPYHLQIASIYNYIMLFCPFLRYLSYKGVLYCIVGTFQYYQYTWFNMICGIYVIATGISTLIYDYRGSLIISTFSLYLISEEDISFIFKAFDQDRDGFLTPIEFKKMLFTFDEKPNHNDFVAALSQIDQDNNQRVSLDNLLSWYRSIDKEETANGRGFFHGVRRQRQNQWEGEDKTINLI